MDWISGIGSLASAIGGVATAGVSAAQANKQDAILANQKAKNDSWFNKEYYQNALDRSENAHLMKQLDKKLKDQYKVANAKSAIMGATPEVLLAEQQAMNNSYANAVGEIARGETMRKEGLHNAYTGRDNALTQQQIQLLKDKANALGTASGNAVQAMSTLLSIDDVADIFRRKK